MPKLESVTERLDNVLTVFRAFRKLVESIGRVLHSTITMFWKSMESIGRDSCNKISPKIAALRQAITNNLDGKMVVFRGRKFVQSIVQGLAHILASILLNLIGNYTWDIVQKKDVERVSGFKLFLRYIPASFTHYLPASFTHYLPLTIMTLILWGVGNHFFMKFQYKGSLPVTVGLQNPHSAGSSQTKVLSNSQGIGPSNPEGPGPSNSQVSRRPDLGILDNDLRLFFYHLKKDYSLPAPEMLATSSIESIAWAEASPGKMALTVHVKGAVTEVELVYKPIVTLPSGSKVLYRRFKIGPETGMLELEDLRKLVLESMSQARILDPGCTLQFGSFAVLKYTDAGLKWWRLEEHWTPSIYDIRESPRNLFDSLCGNPIKWIIRGGNPQTAKLKATTEDEVENLKIFSHYKLGKGEDELVCEEPQIIRHAAPMFRKKVYICASNSVEVQDGVVVNLQSEPIKFTRAYWIFVLQALIPSRWTIIMIFSLSLLEALSHVFHEKHHLLPKFVWGYLDLQHKENIIAGTNLEANAILILSRTWNELYKCFLVYLFVIVIPISVSASWQFLCHQISLAGYDLRRLRRTTTLEETNTILSPIFENNLLETTSRSSSLATQHIEKSRLEDTSTGSPTLPTSSTTPPPVDNSIHPRFQEEDSTDLRHDILSPSSFQKDFRKESPSRDGAASYDQPDGGSSGNNFSANELFPVWVKADFDEKNQESDAKVQDCERVSYDLPPPPPPPQAPLSPEWKEVIDFETGRRYYYDPETNQFSREGPKMGIVIADQHKKPETSSTGPPSNTAASDFQNSTGCESLEKEKNIVEHGDGARVRQTTPLSEDFGDILAGNPTDSSLEASGILVKFTYKQLSVATRGFSEQSLIRRGESFFNTYLGVLPSGIRVAVVKRPDWYAVQHVANPLLWDPGVPIQLQLKHRNVVMILGWCERGSPKSPAMPCLVYEFMPNGSLQKLLFNPVEGKAPSWSQRFKILKGTAAGLDYLHSGWKRKQVIHRNVTCANILLDEEYNAKLGDFGKARVVPHRIELEKPVKTGTFGYIDPHYSSNHKLTYVNAFKRDVYAFGVVVLEVVCAQPSKDLNRDKVSIVEWVCQRLDEGDLMKAVDRRLEDYDTYWVEVVLKIGLLCSLTNSEAGPSMRQVVQMLAGDIPVPPLPPSEDRDRLVNRLVHFENVWLEDVDLSGD